MHYACRHTNTSREIHDMHTERRVCTCDGSTREYIEVWYIVVAALRPTEIWIGVQRKRVSIPARNTLAQGFLHVLRGGGTGNNLDQLAGNDGLAGTVVLDLELANHLTSVLGSVLRGDFVSMVEG